MRSTRGGALLPAIAGGLAGAIGHYFNWYLMMLDASICHLVSGGCTSSLGESPLNPAQALAGAALYAGVSLIFTGWLTAPAGALIGVLLAHASRRYPKSSEF